LSPATENGYQHVYLADVPEGMAALLLGRLNSWGADVLQLAHGSGDDDGAVRGVDDALEARSGMIPVWMRQRAGR
jgi:hypothetical protein